MSIVFYSFFILVLVLVILVLQGKLNENEIFALI